MGQSTQSKNNITYCCKCGRLIKYSDGVKDLDENIFCDDYCRREFWLELRQDHDDVFREIYGKDY